MPSVAGGTTAFAPLSPATGPGAVGSTIDPTGSIGSTIPSDPGSTSGTPPCSSPSCSSLAGPIGANGDKTEGTDDGVTEKNGTGIYKIRPPKSSGVIVGIQGPGIGAIVSPIDTDPVPGINVSNVKAPAPATE